VNTVMNIRIPQKCGISGLHKGILASYDTHRSMEVVSIIIFLKYSFKIFNLGVNHFSL
jgi:hypothetical protein